MCEGYDDEAHQPGPSDCSDLDEFLAEYVDGTMDPAVRAAFEEVMRVYPEVYERVCYLKHVRSELCQLNCQCRAPAGFEQRLRRQLDYEMMREEPPLLAEMTPHLRLAAALASVVLLLVMGGLTYESATTSSEMARAISGSVESTTLEGRDRPAVLPPRFLRPRDAGFSSWPTLGRRVFAGVSAQPVQTSTDHTVHALHGMTPLTRHDSLRIATAGLTPTPLP